jgi:RND family efflux transporter MFP subunit
MTRTAAVSVVPVLLLSLTNCGGSPPPSQTAVPTAKIQNAKPEGDLTTITLSPEAEAHLALQTRQVSLQPIEQTRTVGGEAMVPAGRAVVVTAPVAGTLAPGAGRGAAIGRANAGQVIFELVPLQPSERDDRAQADREVKETAARLDEAASRLRRLEGLLREGSASARSVEEARTAHAVAAAASDAARLRLAALDRLPIGARGAIALAAPFAGVVTAVHGAAGQTMAAGAPVFEIAQTDALWVRVPLYAGDISSVDASKPAAVARLGDDRSGPWRSARRVAGPPAASASAASVDLYFELLNPNADVRPGERVAVRLTLRSSSAERAIVIPQSAVVYDLHGGTWVYEVRAPHAFARRRVEIAGPVSSGVVVRRGLAEGATIVTVGAAELYGTEFYVNK